MTLTTMMPRLLLALLLLGGAAGCASKSGTAPASAYDRDVISLAEIEAVEVRTTALQLIQRLRPMWLQGRGPSGMRTSSAPLPLYVNNQRVGDTSLERYTASELLEIRFLNAMAATQRFGTGHVSGALLITTR